MEDDGVSVDWFSEDAARIEEDLANRHAVRTMQDIRALPADVRKIYVSVLDDAKARAIVAQASEITSIFTDGNNRLTDEGVRDLARLAKLEHLDLEWSAITDAALLWIAQMQTLESVDLEFTDLSPAAVQGLQASRPDLSIAYRKREPGKGPGGTE